MKLDYGIVRELLIFCDNSPLKYGPSNKECMDFAKKHNISIEQLAYTIETLKDNGFITGHTSWSNNKPKILAPGNLTFDGKKFLEPIRQPSIWKETIEQIKDKGLTATLEIIANVSSAIIRKKLNL